MIRTCKDCGGPVPPKEIRPSKSQGLRKSAPKNRPVTCKACRSKMAHCEVCTAPFLRYEEKVKTCGPVCGSVLAMRTRHERGEFDKPAKPKEAKRIRRKPVKPVEWRGSSRDKVQAIREIHRQVKELRQQGMTLTAISAELTAIGAFSQKEASQA